MLPNMDFTKGIERLATIIDPQAYKVYNFGFDQDVLDAFEKNDTAAIAEMTAQGKNSFHILICIKSKHASVICLPYEGEIEDPMGGSFNMPNDDLDEIKIVMFELRFKEKSLNTYEIMKKDCEFKVAKDRVKKSTYLAGKYRNVNYKALQFAALRAAPHQYNVLLNDCVEFAKEFCKCMLHYCSNYIELEKNVNKRISKATATGQSAEHLSRNDESSALLGNTFVGGPDVSTFLGNRFPVIWIVLLLLYHIIVAVLAFYFMQIKG